jgi:adenosylcobinamide-phosphate synthase
VLIYYAVSVKSLKTAALDVARALRTATLAEARQTVAPIVGRDTGQLSRSGVARAAVETVAENLVDGVVSPLFYAAIGGAPLATAFKMVSTLDSMIGYKNDRYSRFGRVAARLDDAANFLPARLCAPVIAAAAQMLFGTGRRALATTRRDGRRHASPNSGIPEAAFAGALGVRLGGPNFYQGVCVDKPFIGADFAEAEPADIKRAGDLMVLSATLWLAAAWPLHVVLWF